MKTTYTVSIYSEGKWEIVYQGTDADNAKRLASCFGIMEVPYKVVRSVDSGLPLVSDPSLN